MKVFSCEQIVASVLSDDFGTPLSATFIISPPFTITDSIYKYFNSESIMITCEVL